MAEPTELSFHDPLREPAWLRLLLILAAVAAMGLLVLLPLAMVLGAAFGSGFKAWWQALATPDARSALKLTLLTAAVVIPVNAVFGFTRDVLFLLENKRPDYFFCAFDIDGRTFRHELFADYKKDRKEMPDDLPQQIELIHWVLGALGVPAVGLEGYEADDVLAEPQQLFHQMRADEARAAGNEPAQRAIAHAPACRAVRGARIGRQSRHTQTPRSRSACASAWHFTSMNKPPFSSLPTK